MTYAEFRSLRHQETMKALTRFASGNKNALKVGRNTIQDLKIHSTSNTE